ncbi:hypothetical protein AVEN_37583-1 [Araneus ventricosus]|uniref:Uncharacterized protein n=1 Tax=Araneus ventricosus TaxID=182803 RepID=A0A4Y2V0I3_ARAVE|nr:hypothetical protein AVEN_37583-1 [Araneus ventricosus]
MEHITYIDRGKRKVMTVDEFIALDFDDFLDEDPTVNSKDLKSSDSDSEPETIVEKVKNSSSIIEKQVHPSIAEAGQLTSSNASQPTASNINQPTSSNKKTDTGKCQILWKKQIGKCQNCKSGGDLTGRKKPKEFWDYFSRNGCGCAPELKRAAEQDGPNQQTGNQSPNAKRIKLLSGKEHPKILRKWKFSNWLNLSLPPVFNIH